MKPIQQLRDAMNAIAKKKGEFALFGLFMPVEAPGRWDLVVAAPWLEVGKLKALGEFVRLLDEQLGEGAVRHFSKIVTLKASSPEIRAELSRLNIANGERHFRRQVLFGADIEEAIVLHARPPRRR